MNRIEFKNKAIKQLKKLQQSDSSAIRVACRDLTNMPNCQNIKALTNHDYQFRLRVGKFRVFFNFEGVVHIVSIEEVKKRDEHTY
jgi:mRNA interferase RelE/StbE